MRLGGSRGGGGGGGQGVRTPPLKNHNTIGFPSNTGLDPLMISRLPSQHSMLGHQRYDSETPFVGPLMVVFGSSLSSSTKKKNVVKVGLPLQRSKKIFQEWKITLKYYSYVGL